MKKSLLKILVCPKCKTQLDLHNGHVNNNEIESGNLHCKCCNTHYPIRKYIPRFVDADQYTDSFSKQRLYVRRHFKHYINDRSGDELFLPSTGFDKDKIKKGLNLEVGCGYGRFLDVVSRKHDGEIIGIDLSTHSVELAQDFVGNREKVHIIQCDLFNLPFRESTFDHIFSIGVLHHTPNTQAAFQAITPYLANGGKIAIWVYPPEMKKSSNRWRIITTHLPNDVLYYFCMFNQLAFSWIRKLPGGWRFNTILPGAHPTKNSHFWHRVLSDFDDLSPTYAWTHSKEEVLEWFTKAGLHDIRDLKRATSVNGANNALDKK